jgi:hypothetical protein
LLREHQHKVLLLRANDLRFRAEEPDDALSSGSISNFAENGFVR